MRLFYGAASPFARIVRVALLETGLDAQVRKQEVTLRDPTSALLPYNPVGRVPTLELDDGDPDRKPTDPELYRHATSGAPIAAQEWLRQVAYTRGNGHRRRHVGGHCHLGARTTPTRQRTLATRDRARNHQGQPDSRCS